MTQSMGMRYVNRMSGQKVKLIQVGDGQVVIVDAEGGRQFVDHADFAASYKPASFPPVVA